MVLSFIIGVIIGMVIAVSFIFMVADISIEIIDGEIPPSDSDDINNSSPSVDTQQPPDEK